MKTHIVTLGEILMRLSPPGHQRLTQTQTLEINYGGGEANVAVSLSNFGLKTSFVSKLPENPLGQAALNHLRSFGVNTDFIHRGGEKIGLYFLEHGASVRSSQVVYDRKLSAIAEAQAEEFDFDEIFAQATWFHVSGITPAISENAAALTMKALEKAKEYGLTTSFDLNFRQKLWSKAQARPVLSQLCQYVDICIGAGASVILDEESSNPKKHWSVADFKNQFIKLQAKYNFKYMASTIRHGVSASHNDLEGLLFDGTNFYQSKTFQLELVDRVGSGDAFTSGLIYGMVAGLLPQENIDFAVAASALKHTIPGDVNRVSVDEVYALMNGGGSDVKR